VKIGLRIIFGPKCLSSPEKKEIPMAAHPTPGLHSLFVTGLQNAHAVENQALALIDRQLDRLVRYPEVADRLRLHRRETETQIVRLDDILRSLGERHSSLKDMALGMVGNMAALSHVLAPDEILKNSFVNYAFEHFEIASYRSLLTLAEAGALPTAAMLIQETLREEEAMAAWIGETLPEITLRYAELREQGRTASH
jgi:ferritin-like metal-binding protein YciE